MKNTVMRSLMHGAYVGATGDTTRLRAMRQMLESELARSAEAAAQTSPTLPGSPAAAKTPEKS